MFRFIRKLFRKPETFFISDLHFMHKNVIQYCNRPYKDVDEMTKGLIKIWNGRVKEGDTIYVLGDFSLNKKWSKEILPLLNGDKILISGNHDYTFEYPPKDTSPRGIQTHKEKCERRRNEYLQHGWKSIHQTLTFKLKNGTDVLLSHLPYANEESLQYDKRYLDMRPRDEGLFLLCGHLHGKFIKNKNMIDVGIDAQKFKILSEEEIIRLIEDPRNYIPSHLTEFYEKIKNNKQEE